MSFFREASLLDRTALALMGAMTILPLAVYAN
ncbi:hypothetical protein J2S22_000938 [Rhodoplanes tepidamans]|nr:hypothetical protein [Rhodoplanes tepidamans]